MGRTAHRFTKARKLRPAFLGCLLALILAGAASANEDVYVQVEPGAFDATDDKACVAIRTTGVGYESARHSGAQARLMARRAAIVDGYRKLASMRGKVLSSLTGKTYYESLDGFIQGATVLQTRYYYDGRVEADMELPVCASTYGAVDYPTVTKALREHRIAVVEVEPDRRVITREEWEELFRKRKGIPTDN